MHDFTDYADTHTEMSIFCGEIVTLAIRTVFV